METGYSPGGFTENLAYQYAVGSTVWVSYSFEPTPIDDDGAGGYILPRAPFGYASEGGPGGIGGVPFWPNLLRVTDGPTDRVFMRLGASATTLT